MDSADDKLCHEDMKADTRRGRKSIPDGATCR
jgi:hypothetical protein